MRTDQYIAWLMKLENDLPMKKREFESIVLSTKGNTINIKRIEKNGSYLVNEMQIKNQHEPFTD